MKPAIRLVAVLAVATLGLVLGASARNKARLAEPATTGSISAENALDRGRIAATESVLVQQFQYGPDHRAELLARGFARTPKR